MKKTLRLTLLAAAAALVLTSCDAMLESLFPSETGQGTKSGSNTLTFHVQGHDAYYYGTYSDPYGGYYYFYGGYPAYWGDYYNNYYQTDASSPVYVTLYDQSGIEISTQNATFTSAGGATARTVDLHFTGLSDGSYHFAVWYDLNGSGTLDVETAYANYYYESQGYIGTTNLSSIYLPYQSSDNVTLTVDLSEYNYYPYYGPLP